MLENIINTVNDIVWSPALVVLLIFAGIYLSIRTRFVQIRRIGIMFRLLESGLRGKGDKSEGGVSSFEAFCIALSGRIGSGNVVGVAMAIVLGGPGAIFWMWVIALLGSATAFTESTLSLIYRRKYKVGWTGGPFCYIEKGLGMKRLGIALAILTIISYGLLLVCLQSNSIATACSNAFSIPPIAIGFVTAALLFSVIVGGSKRIAKVASIVGPYMSVAYLIMALTIIIVHHQNIPGVFAAIFKGAFGLDPAFGGMLGATISMGVKRGLFSNEAGQGSGAIISASADVSHPAKQGLLQAVSVYIDTLLICTATGLMILCSGAVDNPDLGSNYVAYAQASVDTVFRGFGSAFIAIALFFFVFTSIMAYYFYTRSSLNYLCSTAGISKKGQDIIRRICQIALLAMVLIGACTSANLAWTIGDIGVGTTTWINVIALIILCPQAIKSLKDYESGL